MSSQHTSCCRLEVVAGFPTPSWQPLANFYMVVREKVLNPLVAAYLTAHPRLRV
jgi:hypothetical protein